MLRVGLTGGIASGKSTVGRVWADLGAVLVDSDVLARRAVEPGSDGLAAVVARFGPGVLGADGVLDRAALGARVFGDDEARRDLEAIIHPRVRAMTEEAIRAAAPDAVLVHDIPLLVELHRQADYDVVVVVAASERVRLDRLVHDRGMTEDQARARLAAQATDEQRRAVADVWLVNEGSREELVAEATRVWHEVLLPRVRPSARQA